MKALGWEYGAQVAKCWLGKCKTPSSNPSTAKTTKKNESLIILISMLIMKVNYRKQDGIAPEYC
jgi:hypothetical protein